MSDHRFHAKGIIAEPVAHSPRRVRVTVIALTMLSAVLAAGCAVFQSPEDGADASGFIEARSYALASESGGTLSEVLVATGDSVLAGQELLSLNAAGLENVRTQAEARVTAARAALQGLRDRPSDVALLIVQAALSEANGQQEASEAELALLLASYSPFDPPDAELHVAEAKVEVAKAGVQLALAEVERVEAGARTGEIEVAEAVLAEAEAGLSLVELQIAKMTLSSPVDGVVGEVLVNVGETAAPGAPLIEIHEISDLRLTVYVAETHVASLTVGDEVDVMVDAYPLETWVGRIERIADQAQFTPSNVQTVEERVKLVFAVEIALDDEAGRLKAGMPADVNFQH
jgi:HlyD family secretion protein